MTKMFQMAAWMLPLITLMYACNSTVGQLASAETPSYLTAVSERGTLIIATNAEYYPQSAVRPDAERSADTDCAPTQYTAAEMHGFDVAVGIELATRLGLEPCFVTADWDQIVRGGWADRWDVVIASMGITPYRIERFYFSQPYYATPATFYVRAENDTFRSPADLSGKRIGVCVGCTYEAYLRRDLEIPGEEIEYLVMGAEIVGFEEEARLLEALAYNDITTLDAVLTSPALGQAKIEEGLPIRPLGAPVFFEYLAIAIDRQHYTDPLPFVQRVNETIQAMHADGTLATLSHDYYGEDLTDIARDFNVNELEQLP